MTDRKGVPRWLEIVLIVIILCGMAWTLYSIFTLQVPEEFAAGMQVTHGFLLLTLFAALIYCIKGCGKASADWFMFFLIMFTVMKFVFAVAARKATSALVPVTEVIPFGMLCVLAVAKDLGKNKSFILAVVVLLASLVQFMFLTLEGNSLPASAFGSVILSVVLLVMLEAKYEDKATRGSK